MRYMPFTQNDWDECQVTAIKYKILYRLREEGFYRRYSGMCDPAVAVFVKELACFEK